MCLSSNRIYFPGNLSQGCRWIQVYREDRYHGRTPCEREIWIFIVIVSSASEREDYHRCLQLFRKAQDFELLRNKDDTKANECYERSLSYRYYYPAHLSSKSTSTLSGPIDDKINSHSISMTKENNSNERFVSQENSIGTKKTPKKFKESNPFVFFSLEIWYQIICYLKNVVTIALYYFSKVANGSEKSLARKYQSNCRPSQRSFHKVFI